MKRQLPPRHIMHRICLIQRPPNSWVERRLSTARRSVAEILWFAQSKKAIFVPEQKPGLKHCWGHNSSGIGDRLPVGWESRFGTHCRFNGKNRSADRGFCPSKEWVRLDHAFVGRNDL